MGSSVQQAIEKANRGFVEAVGRGDVAAAVEVYTEDATILPPGHGTVTGRAGIQDFWAGAAKKLGITSAELKTDSIEELTPEAAYEVGEYRLRGAAGIVAAGKYVVVWKAEKGDWRWHVDIWNSDPVQ